MTKKLTVVRKCFVEGGGGGFSVFKDSKVGGKMSNSTEVVDCVVRFAVKMTG